MKRRVLGSMGLAVFIVAVIVLLCRMQYRSYMKDYNEKTVMLLEVLLREYPEISERELMEVCNGKSNGSDKVEKLINKYGIDIDSSSIFTTEEQVYRRNVWISVSVALFFVLILIGVIHWQDFRSRRERERITGYLERINKKDYQFDMEHLSEGAQSVLENEVYKTTIMMKESVEREKEDKLRVKDALSDISHQLKTPLTSLSITIDNLRDKTELSAEDRSKLLRNAKRDVGRMNQMIGQILTLSRLEANVITFQRELTEVSVFVRNAIESVEAIADLKNIEIICKEEQGLIALVDGYWEAQAITNILKNGIEHATSTVQITMRNCSLYQEIVIENDGEPIPEKDRKDLFRRFYQGIGAGKESVGIGLSLAYVVIKQDGGHIFVEDAVEYSPGTRFVIRYPAARI